MTVVVSGATGFIGRYVVAELERRNVSPVLLIRPARGQASASGHRTVTIDLHDPSEAAVEQIAAADVLIHLAWGGLPQYRSRHHVTDEAPAHFTFLRRTLESGLKHLVATGTCYEYGMQSGSLSESLEAKPVTAYGLGKDLLRRQLEFLAADAGIGFTWARLFYPYGDGQAPASLWPSLKRAAEAGAAQFDMSPGAQVRDFIRVEDVARHLVSLALGGRGAGIVNLCSGEPISVRAIVERWIAENGWSIALNPGRFGYPDYEPMSFWGNREKLQGTLTELGAR